jgi:hypothetical protein
VLEGEINKLTETEIDLYIWKGENNETALCVQDQTYGNSLIIACDLCFFNR